MDEYLYRVHKITAVLLITFHTTNLSSFNCIYTWLVQVFSFLGSSSRRIVALFHLSHTTIPVTLTTLDLAILMTNA